MDARATPVQPKLIISRFLFAFYLSLVFIINQPCIQLEQKTLVANETASKLAAALGEAEQLRAQVLQLRLQVSALYPFLSLSLFFFPPFISFFRLRPPSYKQRKIKTWPPLITLRKRVIW